MSTDPLIVSLKKPQAGHDVDQKPRRPRKPPVKAILAAVLVMFVLITGWFAYSMMSLTSRNAAPAESQSAEAQTQEIEDIIAKVSELIVLPEGEEPTVATVSDPEKLKDQQFFSNAKVGDKVLIYTNARKAYLYDPAQHRLIEVAPITTEMQ